jgi:hypothetical protein
LDRRLTAFATGAILLLSAGAPAASAQTATERGYDESGGVIGQLQNTASLGGSGTPTSAQPASPSGASSLPFTGLDVAVLGLMGVALAGTGATLRRATRGRRT